MNEFYEKEKQPEHLMYENAVNSYPEFVADLERAKDLMEVIDVLEQYTFVDGGADKERIFFWVGKDDDSIEVQSFLTEEFITLLSEFDHDSPTEAEEIDMKIKHEHLNRAVKRILNIK